MNSPYGGFGLWSVLRALGSEQTLFPLYRRLCCIDSTEDFESLENTQVCGLGFSFGIDFEAALAFRKAHGDYLREFQYSPLEVVVYLTIQ